MLTSAGSAAAKLGLSGSQALNVMYSVLCWVLFELSAALARNNFYQTDLFAYRFLDDAIQFFVQRAAVVINVVQIKFEFGHCLFFQ